VLRKRQNGAIARDSPCSEEKRIKHFYENKPTNSNRPAVGAGLSGVSIESKRNPAPTAGQTILMRQPHFTQAHPFYILHIL
jgi:hypothetical protein